MGAKRGSNVNAEGRCRELVVWVSPGNPSILVLEAFPVPSNKNLQLYLFGSSFRVYCPEH